MEIKIYAFLSLLPFVYVIRKVVKKQDLTCFDVVLTFHTLYFAFVPCVFNSDKINYAVVRNNHEVHFLTFFFYNMFAYMLCIADNILKKRKGFYLYNLTSLIRLAASKIEQRKNVIWIAFAIEIFLWYYLSFSTFFKFKIALEGISQQTLGERLMGILSSTLGFFCVFLLSVYVINIDKVKKRAGKLFIYVLIISLILLVVQISRRESINYLTFIFLLYYSLKNNRLTASAMIKIGTALIFVYFVVFPLITLYRSARNMQINDAISSNVSLIDTMKGCVEQIRSGSVNVAESDNRDTRIWGVYQTYALSMSYFDKNYNGVLTANAISIGIPRIILPSKSETGSQGILERDKDMHLYTDVSDSILWVATMENHYLGNFYALFIFWSIVAIANLLMILFYKYSNDIYFISIYVGYIYSLCSNVEFSPDGILSSLLGLTLVSLLLWGVMRVCYKWI